MKIMSMAEKRKSPVPIYFQERSSKSIRIVLQIVLETGVTVFYDDARGCAYGNDGKTYYPVCREDGDELMVLGWSSDISAEYVI